VFSNHIVDLLVAPRACCNHQGVRRRRCATSRAWRSPRSACSARHEKGRNVGRRVVENQRQQQGQRQRQRQVQRQPAASGPGATAVPVHGHRTRPPVTGSDTDEAISGNQERPWASFCGAPACRRVRRSSRLRSGSPPCGGANRSLFSGDISHLRASRRPSWWLWRASPGGHSRGNPTRHCAHPDSNAGGTMPCTARPPWRDVPCSAGHVILGPRDARDRASRRRGASRNPRDAEPVISPVAIRSPACHSSLSDDWLRHARL
jgi:hypothetical protein